MGMHFLLAGIPAGSRKVSGKIFPTVLPGKGSRPFRASCTRAGNVNSGF